MAGFWKPEACGQTELPDRSVLIGQKLAENAKIHKFKCDFLGDFQTLCLRSVASASPMGSTVPLDLNESLKKIFPGFAGVIHFYGMTEMPNYGTLTFDLSKLGKMMMKDTKIKLVDPDTGTKWFKIIQNAQN